MGKIKMFTKEEKENLKKRVKDFEKYDSYQMMKMMFYSEIKKINRLLSINRFDQIEEFKDVAKKHREQLENYKNDLIESLGFVFGYEES